MSIKKKLLNCNYTQSIVDELRRQGLIEDDEHIKHVRVIVHNNKSKKVEDKIKKLKAKNRKLKKRLKRAKNIAKQSIQKVSESKYARVDDDNIYPVTIVEDRYGGCYSGGAYTAFCMDGSELPWQIDAGDVECDCFWKKYNDIFKEDPNNIYKVGIGRTPNEAVNDLAKKIKNKYEEFSEFDWKVFGENCEILEDWPIEPKSEEDLKETKVHAENLKDCDKKSLIPHLNPTSQMCYSAKHLLEDDNTKDTDEVNEERPTSENPYMYTFASILTDALGLNESFTDNIYQILKLYAFDPADNINNHPDLLYTLKKISISGANYNKEKNEILDKAYGKTEEPKEAETVESDDKDATDTTNKDLGNATHNINHKLTEEECEEIVKRMNEEGGVGIGFVDNNIENGIMHSNDNVTEDEEDPYNPFNYHAKLSGSCTCCDEDIEE